MSTVVDLKNGLLQMLADNNIITYRTDGSTYLATEIAGFKSIMPDSPDMCVVVNVDGTNDNITMPSSQPIIQFALRGKPDDSDSVDNLSDAIFHFFQGRTNFVVGSVTVEQIFRISSVPMGQDDQFRVELADHYTAQIWSAPSANQPDYNL